MNRKKKNGVNTNMYGVPIDKNEPRIKAAISELKAMITKQWPDTTFEVTHDYDPEGIYLIANAPVEDTWDVRDIIGERYVEMQVEEGLPIYVLIESPQMYRQGAT